MDLRKISNVSVDCVILGFDSAGINILLSRRRLQMFDDFYPQIDDWMLTGDHMFKSETLDESALRILKSVTGLDDAYKKQFRTFGNPNRMRNDKDLLWVNSLGVNPQTMSVAYYMLIPTQKMIQNQADIRWFSVESLPELAFDHKEIINWALTDLRQKVMTDPLIFELLPDKFTLNELHAAYEALLDLEIDNRNFRKKAISKTYIVPLDEKRVGTSKKPASLYMFSGDIYRKTGQSHQVINI